MDKTKCFAQFAGNARLVVKHTGPGWTVLEDALDELLAEFGLVCTDRGFDLVDRERELVFHPVQLTPQELRKQYHGEFPPQES